MIEYNSQEKQDSLSHVRFADEELIKTQVLQGEAAQTIIQGKNCSVYKMENETGEGVITRYPVFPGIELLYCDEFVREMPDGYQTVLGENGSTLSGGERQRISIARALLKNAPIILLDEATASLDPENEILVQKAIAKLVEGKTVIMIAHRLRTVVDSDQILVLDNGRLVEHGTHDALMKKNGLYHKLFHIQQESLGWTV